MLDLKFRRKRIWMYSQLRIEEYETIQQHKTDLIINYQIPNNLLLAILQDNQSSYFASLWILLNTLISLLFFYLFSILFWHNYSMKCSNHCETTCKLNIAGSLNATWIYCNGTWTNLSSYEPLLTASTSILGNGSVTTNLTYANMIGTSNLSTYQTDSNITYCFNNFICHL